MSLGKVLLVASRNLFTANGEWRLVASRAQVLAEAFDIETDAEILVMHRHLETGMEAPDVPGFSRHYVSCYGWTDVPRALWLLRNIVRRKLMETAYSTVILSGALVYPFLRFLPRQKTLLDLHGALEELIEYPNPRLGSAWTRNIIYQCMVTLERWAVPRAGGVLVVTHELGKYAVDRYGATGTFVIPCVGEHLTVKEPASTRMLWRKRLGIKEHEIAFVYCGGLSAWQLFDDTVKSYQVWRSGFGVRTRLVLFTPNSEQARTRALALGTPKHEVITLTLDAKQVVPALHACDVGMVLREDNWTNRVAFPNKFAEYCAAGLIIVTSPGLREPARIVSKYGIGVLVNPEQIEEEAANRLSDLRAKALERAEDWCGFYSRCKDLTQEWFSMRRAISPLADFVISSVKEDG